jgi:hypothetical protein
MRSDRVSAPDRGYAQSLTIEQQQLILGIAEQRPEVNASLLLRTLVRDGRIEDGQITESTLRRFLQQHGLDRHTQRKKAKGRVRRRWAAERAGQLWHADVCHGPALSIDGKSVPAPDPCDPRRRLALHRSDARVLPASARSTCSSF